MKMKKPKIIIGALFILLGLLFLLLKVTPFGQWVLLLISLALFVLYAFSGGNSNRINVGLILPASILFMLWLFQFLTNLGLITKEGLLLIFLSAAFWIVFVIHTLPDNKPDYEFRFWPIYPGTILFLIGLSALITFPLWPILFIGIGLFILIK